MCKRFGWRPVEIEVRDSKSFLAPSARCGKAMGARNARRAKLQHTFSCPHYAMRSQVVEEVTFENISHRESVKWQRFPAKSRSVLCGCPLDWEVLMATAGLVREPSCSGRIKSSATKIICYLSSPA